MEMENYIGDSETSDKRDEMEKNKVGLLRALVEAQDPTAKDVDNLMLRRFLRARDLDVKKASMMFLKYLKWRRAMTPNGYISEADIQNELAQEKLYMQGRDKKGCPIGVIFPSKHKCCQRDLDELKKFVVYSLDKLCASIPEGQEKFVIIEDLKGWGYANFDIRAYVAALNIMQGMLMVMLKDEWSFLKVALSGSTSGLLPRAAPQGLPDPCALHLLDCVENYLPIY
ncbi:random slug protein 5 isoform X2 [Amborella trichopoda]|uniref:random slug protein 5 isoform X2 n=1 Tax=Amborella trichopoda TaxID=13333 RepID=UPI0005D3BC63|nr:random slug protein 5 isoform X2 [Amborella trichopoda]XP_020523044.1 random slug protein 5 isoform X2 [Amborella trichopoda]|eukprot:XP_011623394.1 random slug protein 5 isoform X2 [Amborella trichopoda]